MPKRILIVGAGCYGATCAHLLSRAGFSCRIIEQRSHVGGNCHTEFDERSQCHEHRYGAHIFHTDSEKVWAFITQFGQMSAYRHRVVANNGGKFYTLPFNLHTLCEIYGVHTSEEALARLKQARVGNAAPGNMEEWCLSRVGPEIYRLLIEGYSRKQWGREPRELPASIIARLSVRLNFNSDYFDDRYQGIPIDGYTSLFSRMIEGIPLDLGTDFFADRDYWLRQCDHLVYSGAIDRYFDYDEGALEYRTLRFERSYLEAEDYQGIAVVNYTSADVPWTRIVEHQHFEHERSGAAPKRSISLITKEYPASWTVGAEPYYPMDFGDNRETAGRYRQRAQALAPRVFFGGRLGDYRYYDMHQAIGAAMSFCQRFITEYA